MSNDSNATLMLGGGCFWCLEAAYLSLRGVVDVISGYAGGTRPNPSYEQVVTGATGHAEVVQILYRPEIITLRQLLDVFWIIHDPTTLNRQGYDVGTEYRSIIFYRNEHEHSQIQASIEEVASLWSDPIVTEVRPFAPFYRAEEYHRRYFERNRSSAYCNVVINPKLAKLRQKFATLQA